MFSRASDEFMELVWENGQVLMRGRSTNPSSLSCSSDYPKPTANCTGSGGDYPRKRSRLGTMDSVSGLEEFSKNERFLGDDNYHPVFSRFTETYDKYITEAQIVPECQGNNSRPAAAAAYESDHEMEIPQLHRQQNQTFLPQCQVSASLSTGGFLDSDSHQLKLSEPPQQMGSRNFSLLLKPGVVFQSSKDPAGVQDKSPAVKEANQIRQVNSPPKETLPDEQSEAPLYRNDDEGKRALDPLSSPEPHIVRRTADDAGNSMDQVAPDTSICSRRASNDVTHSSLKRRQYFDQRDDVPSLSEESGDEEEVPKSVPIRSGSMKKRTSEVHNLSERKRRDKINKRMRALQALLPNSNKMDKASVLDNAIEYLKTLQLQLQIMSSMGGGQYMPPMMMPNTMQQQIRHFSPMSMRMPIASSPFSNAAAMVGFAAAYQMLPLPMPMASLPPFFPFLGGFPAAVSPFSGSAVTAPPEVAGSANAFSSAPASHEQDEVAVNKIRPHKLSNAPFLLVTSKSGGRNFFVPKMLKAKQMDDC